MALLIGVGQNVVTARTQIYDGSNWVNQSGDSSGNANVAVNADNVGLAKDATLSSIDGKITKCDTDNVKVVSEVAYDSTNDRKKISIENDSVGLAKDATLSSIEGKITKCDTDNVKVVSEVAYDSTNDRKKVSIENDAVGLATENTLSSMNSKITKCDTDNVTIVSIPSVTIGTDNVGLAKENTLSSINDKIPTPTFEQDLGTFTATGAGTGYDTVVGYEKWTWQVISDSSGTAHDVRLQGSIDNSNWFDLDQSNTTGNEMRHVVNKSVRYIRANVVSMGDATSISVKVFAIR